MDVRVSMVTVGEPGQIGYAECVIRTIKEEETELADHRDFDGALPQISRFIDDVYPIRCILSALDYLTLVDIDLAGVS